MNTTENCRFKVGNFKCIAISDRTERFPLDTIVKDISPEQLRQALLECGCSPTENIAYYNCLYVETKQHRMLIDAGWGKDARPFGGVNWSGALVERLQSEGIAPADIDILVITHGDADHTLGITNLKDELVFPNATHILLKDAWDFWSNEANVAQLPGLLTIFARKVLPLIKNQIKVVPAGVEFIPGLQLISAPGHRPGHTAVAITSSGKYLLHLADTVGHPVLMEHSTWHGYADSRQDLAEKDRLRLLNQAESQQALVFGSHLPFPGVGRISRQGEGWRWHPLAEAAN